MEYLQYEDIIAYGALVVFMVLNLIINGISSIQSSFLFSLCTAFALVLNLIINGISSIQEIDITHKKGGNGNVLNLIINGISSIRRIM